MCFAIYSISPFPLFCSSHNLAKLEILHNPEHEIPIPKILHTICFFQGWEFVHSLITHSLILLKSNERFAQIAQDK